MEQPSECKICLAVHLNSLMTLPFPSQQDRDFTAAATAPHLSAASLASAQSSDNCAHNSHRTGTPLWKETRATQCPCAAFTAVGDTWMKWFQLLVMLTASPTFPTRLCNGQGAE